MITLRGCSMVDGSRSAHKLTIVIIADMFLSSGVYGRHLSQWSKNTLEKVVTESNLSAVFSCRPEGNRSNLTK